MKWKKTYYFRLCKMGGWSIRNTVLFIKNIIEGLLAVMLSVSQQRIAKHHVIIITYPHSVHLVL